MSRNRKHSRQSVGRTPRKATSRHTPKVTKPRLVIDLSGRKQRKQLFKNRDLIRRQIISERKRERRSSNNNILQTLKSSSSSALHNQILYPPVPPPPAPSTTRQKKKRQQQQQQQQIKFDTITVIDSEDEGVGSSSQDAIPIFYEDRTGGFDKKDVPVYNSRCGDDGMLLEQTLEEGEIREEEEEEDDLNKAIVNVEEIPIEEDNDDVIEVDDTVADLTVPLPKCEDQSVIFCSEVIDLSRAVDRNKLLDYIPLGFDPDPAEAKQRSPRKKSKKLRTEDNHSKQKEAGQSTAAKEDVRRTKRMVVIDGNNVAFGHTIGQAFSVKGLDICIQYFKKMGHNVKAIVPQFRLKKGKSTDQKRLEELYKAGDVLLAPSKNLPGQSSSSYDDRLIISVAEKFDAVVVSNDNFRDLLAESDSWKKIIETRVIGYTWVMDAFFIPDDPYGRRGPKLKELLEPVVVAEK